MRQNVDKDFQNRTEPIGPGKPLLPTTSLLVEIPQEIEWVKETKQTNKNSITLLAQNLVLVKQNKKIFFEKFY